MPSRTICTRTLQSLFRSFLEGTTAQHILAHCIGTFLIAHLVRYWSPAAVTTVTRTHTWKATTPACMPRAGAHIPVRKSQSRCAGALLAGLCGSAVLGTCMCARCRAPSIKASNDAVRREACKNNPDVTLGRGPIASIAPAASKDLYAVWDAGRAGARTHRRW